LSSEGKPNFTYQELLAEIEAHFRRAPEDAFTTSEICERMGKNPLRDSDMQAATRLRRTLMADGKLKYAGKKYMRRVDGSTFPCNAYKGVGEEEEE